MESVKVVQQIMLVMTRLTVKLCIHIAIKLLKMYIYAFVHKVKQTIVHLPSGRWWRCSALLK